MLDAETLLRQLNEITLQRGIRYKFIFADVETINGKIMHTSLVFDIPALGKHTAFKSEALTWEQAIDLLNTDRKVCAALLHANELVSRIVEPKIIDSIRGLAPFHIEPQSKIEARAKIIDNFMAQFIYDGKKQC